MMFQAGITWAFFGFACSERAKPKQSPSTVAVALHGFNPQPLLASETTDLEFGGWQQRAGSGGLCVCLRVF